MDYKQVSLLTQLSTQIGQLSWAKFITPDFKAFLSGGISG